ncbi:MAG: phosphoribosylanthranilate isomerase [Burkholderiaceae bacterium]
MRTRIKICGLTRSDDVAAAAVVGADAVGFVCYLKSPRFVGPERLLELARAVPPLVTPVLLFVNAAPAEVRAALELVPHALLQFHGDEPEVWCAQFQRPWLRAVRMAEGVDLLDCERRFPSAAGLLADAPSAGFGGSGESFDWSRLPLRRSRPLILAGGLNADNVGAAITQVRPWAVDVSSGVESAPGIKDARRIHEFIAAVRAADDTQSSS